MLARMVAQLIGLSLFASSAQAAMQKVVSVAPEKWELYTRTAEDGRPLVVIARQRDESKETLLQNGIVTLVRCRADPDAVNGQGMPKGTDRLYPLEDRLDEEPALRAVGGIRVASVTGQGERRMILVHRSPIDLAPVLSAFPVEGYTCGTSAVSDRAALIQLVTPTEVEHQFNADADVIASLEKQGDDGHAPRSTDFWFYGSPEALKATAGRLGPLGFSVKRWLDGRSGIVLSRTMPVDLSSFQAVTPAIVDAAGQNDVEYDGWETEVISASAK